MLESTFKNQVIKALEEMPQDVTFEEIMERLYFLHKIDQGLKQVKAGETISHEAAKKQIKTWQR